MVKWHTENDKKLNNHIICIIKQKIRRGFIYAMPVSRSLFILIYLNKQLINCKTSLKEMKHKEISFIIDVILLLVFTCTCLSAQNNRVLSCVTRDPCMALWSGFYCAYWVHDTKALKYTKSYWNSVDTCITETLR